MITLWYIEETKYNIHRDVIYSKNVMIGSIETFQIFL